MDDDAMVSLYDKRGPVEWRLHLLRIAIEMGSFRTFRNCVAQWGEDLAACEVHVRREEYAWLLRKAERMSEIERVHGQGSLIELDHPFVLSILNSPKPSLTDEEVQAARRYRAISDTTA